MGHKNLFLKRWFDLLIEPTIETNFGVILPHVSISLGQNPTRKKRPKISFTCPRRIRIIILYKGNKLNAQEGEKNVKN